MHQSTLRCLRVLRLAQNCDVHLLALKKLMDEELLDNAVFPEDVQDFATVLQQHDILCFNYIPQQRVLHVRTVHDRRAPTSPA